MTMTSTDSTRPSPSRATATATDARLGLVAGDRIRRLDADDLGAASLNAFLAAPRLGPPRARSRDGRRTDGCRWPTSR